MNILIRSDASMQIGTGHIMRCLTLAGRLREGGHHVSFVCRSHPSNLMEQIQRQGFTVHALVTGIDIPLSTAQPKHASWLGASQQEDADAVISILTLLGQQGKPIDGLIIDHYGLDATWEKRMRPWVEWITVIDDLADRPHDCDLLLDQNHYFNAEIRYVKLVPATCKMLLGPHWSLLRPEFSALRKHPLRDRSMLRRILIFFGGTDPGDDTFKAVQALEFPEMEGIVADVVVGEANPHLEKITKACARQPKIQLHVQVDHMASLMAKADLAIGAGGTTSWERCCLGLPSLLVCVAENQKELIQDLEHAGAVRSLGQSVAVSGNSIATAIQNLVVHPKALMKMAEISAQLVDGLGVNRVAEAILNLKANVTSTTRGSSEADVTSLRRAKIQDLMQYFNWTNEEETRKNSFQTNPIDLETHTQWFQARLKDSECAMYILEVNGKSAGQIRFQFEVGVAEIGFSVAPEFRKRGIGVLLLKLGTERLRHEFHGKYNIQGMVKKGNLASAKAFIKAGFSSGIETTYQGVESLLFIQKVGDSV